MSGKSVPVGDGEESLRLIEALSSVQVSFMAIL
jgi:hypothetical protein